MPLRQYTGPRHAPTEVDPSPIIADPFAELDQMDWQSQGLMSILLRGNGYGQVIEFDRRGLPAQVKPVHPDDAKVSRLATGEIEYRFFNKPVPVDQVFHVRSRSLPGSLVGVSPIEFVRRSFAIGIATDAYAAAFFANSASPGGVIQLPPEAVLDNDQKLALARQWQTMHQGPGKAYMPAVLTGGAEWKQVTLTPEDSQFIQTHGLTFANASAIYRVPPHMIGATDKSTSWGTGIEQQELGFVRNTLLWWARRLERSLDTLLPPGNFVRFDFSERLRGDTLQRMQAYNIGRNMGIWSANDIRIKEGEPAIEGGDTYLQPLNMGDASTSTPAPDVPPQEG